jgi:UDP-GlcNAc:undecaprenyl-phosphate GlcNAc-1-phosphate transferase
MNALNFSDGIDGMAGSLSLVTFFSIALLAFIAGASQSLQLALIFSAILVPFLFMNLCIGLRKTSRIFMGDAGSFFLGLGIAWLLVELSQGEQRAFAPVTALWLFSVPLIDTVSIMLRRILKGQSPFKPDCEHLHHFFLRIGYSDRAALAIIVVISSMMASIGILLELNGVTEWKIFSLFIGVFLIYFLGIMRAWRVTKVMKKLV